MARTMYDSIESIVTDLPDGADMYAGYDDGAWPDGDAIAARFPGKTVIRVTVNPSDNEGDMLDVEKGDANPADAPGWVERRRAAGHKGPLVYCGEANWPAVRSAFAAARVAEPGYLVAAYPGNPPYNGAVIPPGAIGHQYGDAGSYDLSVMVDYLPGIDPAPKPAPKPEPPPVKEDTTMVTSSTRNDSTGTTTMLDVYRENTDGSVQHWWQAQTGQYAGKWEGPETLPSKAA